MQSESLETVFAVLALATVLVSARSWAWWHRNQYRKFEENKKTEHG